MTSIFEGQPPKTRNKGHLGSRYVYVKYMSIVTVYGYLVSQLTDPVKLVVFDHFPRDPGENEKLVGG